MPVDPSAAELRRRAAALRRLATYLDETPLDALVLWAGPDTWVSPRAEQLRAELQTDRLRLRQAADEQRQHAHWLLRQADTADAAAALRAATVVPF
jgi:hypothetical protein